MRDEENQLAQVEKTVSIGNIRIYTMTLRILRALEARRGYIPACYDCRVKFKVGDRVVTKSGGQYGRSKKAIRHEACARRINII